MTVVSGVMFLWLPDGASVEEVGFEIGEYRVRATTAGGVQVDKPQDLVAKYEAEWAALLAECDAEFAAEQRKRRDETLRKNLKAGAALGTDQLSFS